MKTVPAINPAPLAVSEADSLARLRDHADNLARLATATAELTAELAADLGRLSDQTAARRRLEDFAAKLVEEDRARRR